MWNDLRYGVRALWMNPAFTAATALTLAIGIGLNATLFSILNFLLFKPIPVSDADQVVWMTGATTGPTPARERFTLPDALDFKGAGGAIGDVLAYAGTSMLLRSGAQAMRVEGQIVTANYFAMLGVAPAAGRVLRPEDDAVNAEAAAVMSDGLAKRLFPSAEAAVGKRIDIDGHPFTVAGVTAAGFNGTDILSPADVWVAMSAAHPVAGIRDPMNRDTWWLRAMARLRPDASLAAAQAAAAGVAASIAQANPDSHRGFHVRLVAANGAGPHDRQEFAILAALPAVPLLILLIACANVAGLLLSRGVARSREIGIRAAIGASRLQIVRQLLVESLLLSAVGGVGSFLLLLWSPELVVRFVGAPLAGDLTPDGRVLSFTAVLSIVTAAMFGLAPALRASRASTVAALRSEPGSGGSGRSTRLQRALVSAQLALSLVLLAASGLFLQALQAANQADVGFETRDRVTLSFDLQQQRFPAPRAEAFYRALLERAAAMPGVRSVTFASYVPLGGRVEFTPVFDSARPVDPDARQVTTGINAVGPRFLETMQLPIVRGRALDARDFGPGGNAVVVNETLARRFWPDEDPIGRRIRLGAPDSPARDVVGIARDVVIDEFGEDPRPFVYVPHDGRPDAVSLIAWTSTGEAATLRALERLATEIDPTVAAFDPMTMAQHLANRMDGERGLARIVGAAAFIALGLAAFGLYGVVAYAVSQRTREIGLRMALGARPEDVRRLFMTDGARIVMWGLGAGLLPAMGVALLLSTALFGVNPWDIRALAVAAVLLGAAAMLASFLPARRATRVDPLIALRTDH